MASTPFRAVSWNPTELVSDAQMDQLASNQTWLYDNTPRAFHTSYDGTKVTEGLKIMSGKAIIAPNTKGDSRTVNVNFPTYFVSNCRPNITTGIITNGQNRIFCSINGLGTAIHPDHRGFQISVNLSAEKAKNDKLKRTMYVSWLAMGY